MSNQIKNMVLFILYIISLIYMAYNHSKHSNLNSHLWLGIGELCLSFFIYVLILKITDWMWIYFKEINAIGIKDWIWFVIYLKRDEFSPKLEIDHYYPDKLSFLIKDRNKAHKLDMQLQDIKYNR